MRKCTALLLALSLAALMGCSKAPAAAVSEPASSAASEVAADGSQNLPEATIASAAEEQRHVLNGFVDFAADTAGGSLKTARAAATLVEYLSYADIDAAAATDWMAALTQDQRDLLDTNWSGILENAQNIVSDPAGQVDLLASAGVTTDFESMTLTEVPDKLVTLNTVFAGKAG